MPEYGSEAIPAAIDGCTPGWGQGSDPCYLGGHRCPSCVAGCPHDPMLAAEERVTRLAAQRTHVAAAMVAETDVLRAAADGEMAQALDALRAARGRTWESEAALAAAVDDFLEVAEDIAARFPLPVRPSCGDEDCGTSGVCQDAGSCWGPPKAGA